MGIRMCTAQRYDKEVEGLGLVVLVEVEVEEVTVAVAVHPEVEVEKIGSRLGDKQFVRRQ